MVVLLLAACGARGASTNRPVDVNVTLGEFTIESSVTEFKPGVQYRFTVTNKGQVPHEFMIMPVETDAMEMMGMSMEEMDALAFMVIPEEKLPSGVTVVMEYAFTGVPEGNIEFVCALPGHVEAGMYTPITVR
jgi:uncharacterized cupredoxin-like copper-binding protein